MHETVSSQKRAYGILDSVLELHGEQVLYQMEPAGAGGILAVVCDSLMTCHVSARNLRLRYVNTCGIMGIRGYGNMRFDMLRLQRTITLFYCCHIPYLVVHWEAMLIFFYHTLQ